MRIARSFCKTSQSVGQQSVPRAVRRNGIGLPSVASGFVQGVSAGIERPFSIAHSQQERISGSKSAGSAHRVERRKSDKQTLTEKERQQLLSDLSDASVSKQQVQCGYACSGIETGSRGRRHFQEALGSD